MQMISYVQEYVFITN